MIFRLRGGPLARIVQMAAAIAASDLARSAVRFLTSLVVARGLGPEAFGRWTFDLAAASMLTVAFDLGLHVLLTREAAIDDGDAGSLLAGAVAVRLTVFLPAALAVGVLLPAAGLAPAGAARAIVALAAAGLAYGCVAAIHRAKPGRLAAILAIELGGAIALGAGTLGIAARSGGVVDLLHLATVVELVQIAGALALWRAVAPRDRVRRPTVRFARALLARAWPFAASGFVANAQTRVAPLLVGWLAGAGEVASLGVAVRLENIARRAPYAAFGAAFPVFAGEVGRGQCQHIRRRFERGLHWFAGAAALFLIAGAGPIVRATYGAAFAAAAWPLAFAGLGLVPALANSSREVFLAATGRERDALRWGSVALAVQAAACLLLIPEFGASGAMGALAAGEMAVWLPLRLAARGRARVIDDARADGSVMAAASSS